MDRCSLEYKRALEAYLRHGTPMIRSLKQARSTALYIWRTRGDGKVRPEHAANNGKVFAWDDPPPTGHPGEDYGCRCTAEPYEPDVSEFFDITLSGVSDTGPAWTSYDYSWHYFFGGGKPVALRETGNISKVVAEYRRIVIDDPKRLPTQIANKAREKVGQSFSYRFERGDYNMRHIVYALGDTTIKGKCNGHCQKIGNSLLISGSIDFELTDEFRDPLNIGTVLGWFGIDPLIDEIIKNAIADGIRDVARIGSRIRDKIGDTVYRVLRNYIEQRIKQIEREILNPRIPRLKKTSLYANDLCRKDLRELLFTDHYAIKDAWRGTFKARVYEEKTKSRYTF